MLGRVWHVGPKKYINVLIFWLRHNSNLSMKIRKNKRIKYMTLTQQTLQTVLLFHSTFSSKGELLTYEIHLDNWHHVWNNKIEDKALFSTKEMLWKNKKLLVTFY
eukprot:GHVP01044099.1.p1 GENE.GHVP01044099.1~~GHVP01044099.1.p1  ORF type:complete len:105 (+),score=9.75 GHVP01044099.1:175-489(+)